jgi:ferredoxin-NADP reductase
MILEILGYGLIALVVAGAALAFARQVRRDRFEETRDLIELAVLQTRLDTERDLRLAKSRSLLPWNGLRKFVVKQKVIEAEGLCSFYLSPHDGKALPGFMPGQYLTFQLRPAGLSKPIIRCYSLSDRPREDYYRITVKRVAGEDAGSPPGIGSNFFHDGVREGDILDVKAPGGHFFLDPASEGGVVLIGGGIGVTPMLSMLHTLIERRSRRDIWFFYSVRNSDDHIMAESLRAIGLENPNVHVVVCYSRPKPGDAKGQHYDEASRVGVDLFKRLLPSSNFDYYMCGPGSMMESLTVDLTEWGVPESRIHFETFGPSSVKKVGAATRPPMPVADKCTVTFKRSGKVVAWTGACGNLLELAEQASVAVASGCRSGNCGTCAVAIQKGDVSYLQTPGSPPEAGTCLTCVATPKGDLVLDA